RGSRAVREEDAFGRDNEKSSVAVFCKGRGKVAGDQAHGIQGFDFSVVNFLDSVLRRNPNMALPIFVQRAYPLSVESAVFAERNDFLAALQQNSAVIGADPQICRAAVEDGI